MAHNQPYKSSDELKKINTYRVRDKKNMYVQKSRDEKKFRHKLAKRLITKRTVNDSVILLLLCKSVFATHCEKKVTVDFSVCT